MTFSNRNHQWYNDPNVIRKVMEYESLGVCPSCRMPFDKGKKRKLIDTCGHERCYSCILQTERCTLCIPNGCVVKRAMTNNDPPPSHQTGAFSPRPQVKTNGHFTTYMQVRQDQCCFKPRDPVSPGGLIKSRTAPGLKSMAESFGAISKNCPTPPPLRKILSPKLTRISWAQKHSQSLRATASQTTLAESTSCLKESKKNERSHPDLFGFLFGEKSRRKKKASPPPNSGVHSQDSCNSSSSLGSFEASNSTSPVSTLTVSSADVEVHCSPGQIHQEPSFDSLTSLISISNPSGYHQSASPNNILPRRHSVTTSQPGPVEELGLFGKRQASVRRSARTAVVKGPLDPKVRFAQYRTPQLVLKPLFFEVPQPEGPDTLFVGRSWLFEEIERSLNSEASSSRGVVISGHSGTGKTAIVLQLVEHSCFGRKRAEPQYYEPYMSQAKLPTSNNNNNGSQIVCSQPNLVPLQTLASHIVAYHFCQADNSNTCLVPDFVHSVSAQLCQAPQLTAYREHVINDPHLQTVLSLRECIIAPDASFVKGVLEPLSLLRRQNKIPNDYYVLVVDALCEAEYHRPDYGDTIASFLTRHVIKFPNWLKLMVTVRSSLHDVTKMLPFHGICLDHIASNDNLQKDLGEYIATRVQMSPSVRQNVYGSVNKPSDLQSNGNNNVQNNSRFVTHLLALSKGCFLYLKLTLDLVEQGSLVIKSKSYKVLPVSLAQLFLLQCNLRFPTVRSFEKCERVLAVCLASLYPMTLVEIYYSVAALFTKKPLVWEDFLDRFQVLSQFLVKRLDDTYMFFHPTFREWLIRRDDGDSSKFLCDLRAGHAGIAFRMSRVEPPLNAEKTVELGHHILKAHIYKNMKQTPLTSRDLHAYWMCLCSEDVSDSLMSLRNVFNPNVKVSRLLLLSGSSPNSQTKFLHGATLLGVCCYEGFTEMVVLLLEFGADPNANNLEGSTPLSLAAAKGHGDIVRSLVANGAKIDSQDDTGRGALWHAAYQGHFHIVAYLLSLEWEDDIAFVQAGQQSLVAAATKGHVQIVQYLLDMSGVELNVVDYVSGETALTAAAAFGQSEVCSLLLQRKANSCVKNMKDVPPLVTAVKEGHRTVVEILVQEGKAPLEQTDGQGKTCLIAAAMEGHADIITYLLDKGASVHIQDKDGLTALSWASLRGKTCEAQCLIDRGADVNHPDKTGRTPLDLAACSGDDSVVQLLLERGALIEHVDLQGMRPLDRAIGCQHLGVVQCFLRKGAKLGPATWAMATGKPEIMVVLLTKLLEDGTVLYKKNRLKEASHRFQYALKKIPYEDYGDYNKTFQHLKMQLMLNLARCKGKMNETEETINITNEVLKLWPDCYEAYYVRARARRENKQFQDAILDLNEAISLAPQNRLVRQLLMKMKQQLQKDSQGIGGPSKYSFSPNKTLGSIDTLQEVDFNSLI